jgi:hypothetical protein
LTAALTGIKIFLNIAADPALFNREETRMTAKSAHRPKVVRVSKTGVRFVSGADFWTPARRKAALARTKPVPGERELFKATRAMMAARGG